MHELDSERQLSYSKLAGITVEHPVTSTICTGTTGTMVHTLVVLLSNPVLTRRYSNSNHRIYFPKMKLTLLHFCKQVFHPT